MKIQNKILQIVMVLSCVSLLQSCSGKAEGTATEEVQDDHGHEHEPTVYFTAQQFDALQMKVDSLPMKNLTAFVETNGQLEVPPQSEAGVTAIIGSNVVAIKVIEGEKVRKGQVLAYLSHPNLISIQTEYVENWNQLEFIEQDYLRQEKLLSEKVGSEKQFQKIKADYFSMKGRVGGLEAQLHQLGLSVEKLRSSKITAQVPVRSPIDGYIRLVEVKIGQFVAPEYEMFSIVNVDHVHADLMVYEKDAHKIKKGQKVMFTVESLQGKELEATIYSVGKAFEQDPKAIHLHAEIENKEGVLLPGMYVSGRIALENEHVYALPEEAVVREGIRYFIFSAKNYTDKNGDSKWSFSPIEVRIGGNDNGWTILYLLKPLKAGSQVVWNNAYYLQSELKKEEAEHSH